MLFTQPTFFLFFVAVVLLHQLPLGWSARKANLLLASYLFYAAWNPPFVALLWLSTCVDWFVARGLHRSESKAARRALLAASLSVNLGLLAGFKYGGFLIDNLRFAAGLIDVELTLAAPDLILPVGISFYTFQTLSYSIDIYRRQAEPSDSFLDYALFVTFFPQLVAGPIVRATQFLPQCRDETRPSSQQVGWGLALVVLGLFEKVSLADGFLAPVVEQVFDGVAVPSVAAAWAGTFAFSGQIFCDFAGYSTCAIGLAMILGFKLPDNFRFPYAACGFSDFWQRWHISLSSFLRDYLYIPLGGNRRGRTRTSVNLAITMLLGGLWHGASWTFVIWGALHGLFLVGERLLVRALDTLGWRERIPFRRDLGAAVTFVLVCFAWVFFRADTLDRAGVMLGAMFGRAGLAGVHVAASQILAVALVVGGILVAHRLLRDTSLEAAAARVPWPVRAALLASMVVLTVTSSGEDRAFIYFQF